MKNLKWLSRNELKKIIGGKVDPSGLEPPGGRCKISYFAPGKAIEPQNAIWYNISTNGTCANQQIQANAACLSALEAQNLNGDRCFFDCECDDKTVLT